MDCLFCKIIAGEVTATTIYEDERILAFNDINPKAPVHVLIIPKEHIQSADNIDSSNSIYVSHLFEKIPEIAKKLKILGSYRIVNNCGEKSGQTVNHLHFHVLGGRAMKWPPG